MKQKTAEVPNESVPDFGPTDLPAGVDIPTGDAPTPAEQAELEEVLEEIIGEANAEGDGAVGGDIERDI